MSDNEVGPEVGVEVADFEDHRLPTGESKRSSYTEDIIGDTPPSSSAMRACEAALQAALTSNQAFVRKNDEITTELDILRKKHEQAVDELRQQRELVAMLKSQQLGTDISGMGVSSGGGTFGGKKVSGLLEQELELCKEKLISQENKLKQAAEFVNFQEEQIQNLKDDVEDMREQAAIASGKFGNPTSSTNPDVSLNSKLRNELMEQKSLVEKYLTQIQDGASYVQHLQEQLDQAHDDVTRLRSQLNRNNDDDSDNDFADVTALQKELALKKEKIDKAAAYVKYQDNVISELTLELEELKGNQTVDNDRGDDVAMMKKRMEELESRLAQGATYCEYVQSQLDAATAEVESSKQAMTDLQQRWQQSEETIDSLREQIRNGSGNSAVAQQEMIRELEQAQRLCAAYQVQMQRGSEYVDELKAELLGAQKRLVRLEMLQANNKTRSSSGGYDPNMERISTLENELTAVFAELDKTRSKLAAGGATQNEVQFYKSQNETYLMKMQQGTDRMDMLQRKLLETESELTRANSRPRGGAGDAVRSIVVPADHVVQELIEYKMKFAAAATDVDHERRKGQEAILKLQAAGHRIAALEAALLRAQEAADEKPKGMFSFFTGSSSSGSGSVTGGNELRPRSSSQVSAAESAHGSVAGSVAASESGYRPGMRASPHRYGPSLGPGRGYPGGSGGIPGGRGVGGGYIPVSGPGTGPSPFLSPPLGGRPGPGPGPGQGGGGMGPGRGMGMGNLQLQQPGRPMMMQRPMTGGPGSMQQQQQQGIRR